ncbi:hypothetical protein SRABI118_00946 [Massilia sp. Bi118]|uniref:hypothetical protein n=1 Tax=Massilia sp. Bi118 TaxID=2822346 RepID=UPI001D51EB3F|nr:hypothetical protein [Massilia sp. Bi118]CAH0169073.1 hypothetical protein SRABI118_00946 [Massilia sp. Bi118]
MSGSKDAAVLFTLTDIDVGSRLVEALVQHAKSTGGKPIAYEDLLTMGRSMYPKDATLGREVPVGIGVKLAFVRGFCKASALPDLACLAVNKATMRPGPGYKGDWEAERRAVASFDWSSANPRLVTYAGEMRAAIPKRLKPRKERPADVAWYAYFCSHRPACAQVAEDDKKEIINLLMAGLDPETALQRVLAAKAELGELS